MSKDTFLGTKLPGPLYLKFSIIATRKGKSRSAMLRKLALDLIARDDARKTREKKEGAPA